MPSKLFLYHEHSSIHVHLTQIVFIFSSLLINLILLFRSHFIPFCVFIVKRLIFFINFILGSNLIPSFKAELSMNSFNSNVCFVDQLNDWQKMAILLLRAIPMKLWIGRIFLLPKWCSYQLIQKLDYISSIYITI